MNKRTLVASMILAMGWQLPAWAEEAVDPQALFAEAMQLRDSGQLFESIGVFESILDRQPGLGRVRLEMAVAFTQLRRFADAREQLTQVLNDPETPETVKLTITSYLAQMSADEKSVGNRTSSTVFVSAGVFSDSNVNLGPSAETPNVSLTETSGSGMTVMASYSHVSRASAPYGINNKRADLSWNTQATAYSKVHTGDENDFNLHVLSLTTGPALVSDKAWRGAFNIKADRIFFDDNPYSFNLGLNPSFTLIYGDYEVLLENLTTVREYDAVANQGLDGVSKMYGVGLTRFFSHQTMAVEGGVRYHSNGAKASHLYANGAEIYLGGQMPAWRDARTYLQLSSRDYSYSTADTANGFTEARDETETRIILGVSHDFKEGVFKSWTLNAQAARTSNDSNIAAFDYDRDVIEVNLRRYF